MSYLERLAKSVRRYQPEDREMVDSFQLDMFGPDARQTRPAYFDWLYGSNPDMHGEDRPLWILDRKGKVVGQQGAMPVELQVDGHMHEAQWALDLMVRPEWRMRGAGPLLSDAMLESADLTMAVGVSEEASKAFVSAGWVDMGRLPLFVRPLRASCLLADRGAPWWLIELVKKTPQEAIGASAWAVSRVLETVSGTHLEPIAAFDSRVDDLWTRACEDYPIAVRRDSTYLKWRFDHPAHAGRYRRFYLVRGEQVLGYVVTRVGVWHEMPVGHIVDHFSPMRWTAPLLGEAVEQLHTQEVAAVFYEGLDHRAELALHALGFLTGPALTTFMLKASRELSVTDEWLRDPKHWFVTGGDADRDFGGDAT